MLFRKLIDQTTSNNIRSPRISGEDEIKEEDEEFEEEEDEDRVDVVGLDSLQSMNTGTAG